MRLANTKSVPLFAVAFFLGAQGATRADTILVPEDYPTIQQAIDAAAEGDEIIVAPGTYREAINLLGKAIHLHSSGGQGSTTIDAAGLDTSVVTCAAGEGPDTILEGFTITGGIGTLDERGRRRCGGGMYNMDGSPTVTNCIFIRNSADDGGGMFNGWDISPSVIRCTFTRNAGGGMYNASDELTVSDCTFSRNLGNGLENCGVRPTITGCIFFKNSGCGMSNRCESTSPTVTDCVFGGNGDGGMFNGEDCNPLVTGCVFIGNSTEGNGGGMLNWEAHPRVVNCLFVGNSAGGIGGGMHSTNGGTPTLIHCAFRGNTAKYGGAISSGDETNHTEIINCTFSGNRAHDGRTLACDRKYGRPSTVRIVNSILYNGGDEIWNNDGSSITITFSDVQGGYAGLGNIDADPLFVNPDASDFRLAGGSPCIDAADNTAVPPDEFDLDGDGDTEEPTPDDLDGNPRYVDDPETKDTGRGGCPVVDMGAYEFQAEGGCCLRDPRWICDGDVDGDGQVNAVDAGLVQAAFGSIDDQDLCNYDLDCDGQINPVDAGIVQSLFGTCAAPRGACP